MTDLIKMRRDDGKEADVHPDMVEDYIKGGYVAVVVEIAAPSRRAKSKK